MRAYERFLDYVKIHTTSDESSGMHPSFVGEFNLAHLLEKQLSDLGLEKVKVDDHAYVYGFLPASAGYENAVPLGLIAHMDTAPDASGLNVKPIIHENYDGCDVVLGESGRVLSVEKFPWIVNFKGETLITSDGTTLLGADDKAGVAEIMTALAELIEKRIPHGPIWVGFTPDEEIGEGADLFDLEYFGAKYAYTVDGGDVNCFEYENFNAASAHVDVTGLSVHPGDAKDTMINAINVAIEFHNMLPEDARPEHTEKREGFFHLTDIGGDVQSATLDYIVRDHDISLFTEKKENMEKIADKLNMKYGEGTVKLTLRDSYFNMKEKIEPHMHLVENALAAIKAAGLEPEVIPVRGGTDGARLSYDGLPCPNLGTGGCNFHGEYECITAERMDKAVDIVLGIIDIYKNRIE